MLPLHLRFRQICKNEKHKVSTRMALRCGYREISFIPFLLIQIPHCSPVFGRPFICSFHCLDICVYLHLHHPRQRHPFRACFVWKTRNVYRFKAEIALTVNLIFVLPSILCFFFYFLFLHTVPIPPHSPPLSFPFHNLPSTLSSSRHILLSFDIVDHATETFYSCFDKSILLPSFLPVSKTRQR